MSISEKKEDIFISIYIHIQTEFTMTLLVKLRFWFIMKFLFLMFKPPVFFRLLVRESSGEEGVKLLCIQ